MAWMYILECADGSYYVSSTNDLEKRIKQHQDGTGAQYTSSRLPVRLVYSEEFNNVSEAYVREKQVQNWSRAKREGLIQGDCFAIPLRLRSLRSLPALYLRYWRRQRAGSQWHSKEEIATLAPVNDNKKVYL